MVAMLRLGILGGGYDARLVLGETPQQGLLCHPTGDHGYVSLR
jgi:hypothetical protein